MRIGKRYAVLAMLPSVLVLLALVVFPTLFVFSVSVRNYVLTDPLNRDFVGLENFQRVLEDTRFWLASLRTGIFTAISLVVSLVGGIALGVYLNSGLRGVGLVRAALIVPMVLTPLVTGAVFRFMLDADAGIVTYALGEAGVGNTAFLAEPRLALPTVAVVDAWQWTPFVALVVAAGLETVPRSALEAVRLEGATAWQEFRYLQLPLLRPILAVVILIRLMDSVREFDKLFIMTGGGPGTSSETLPLLLWRTAFSYYDMGFAAAMGIVMLLAISVLATVFVRRFRALRGRSE